VSALKRQLAAADARIAEHESQAVAAAGELQAAKNSSALSASRAHALEVSRSEMESLLVSLNEKLSVSTQQNDAAALEVQQLQARVSDMEASVISLQYDLEVQQDKASSAENVCALLRTRVATEIQSGVEFERHRNELLRIACGHLQEQLLAARSAAAALDSENSTTYSELEAAFLALQLKFDASVNEIVELKRSISFLKGTEFCQADASSQKPSSAIESLSSCSPDHRWASRREDSPGQPDRLLGAAAAQCSAAH
jgi:chromosome segregation ATPase